MPLVEIETDKGFELLDLDDISRVRQLEDDTADPKIELILKNTGETILVNESYDSYLERAHGNQSTYSYYKRLIRAPMKIAELEKKAEEFDEAAAKWRNREDEEQFPL